MPRLLLGPMLRYVGETCATVWVETDAPCTVEVVGVPVAASSRTFTVHDHHYALVIVEGLEPGSVLPYEVSLDGGVVWPQPGSDLPPSCIRTLGGDGALRVVFGSCRTAAPHAPPWNLELDSDPRGRGVDALYAHALRMLEQPAAEWPHLAVFLGDQVYADDASPRTWERVHERRKHTDLDENLLPDDHVDGFEEYCWLYDEAWTPEVERWFFSVVPSVMIFDDHDMVDDWNISGRWLDWVRTQPWWDEHVRGGLMTYWIYQHLGNLDPQTIRDEGLLARLLTVEDGTSVLRAWAHETADCAGREGTYRFSFVRELGDVRLVMIDTRHDRVLAAGERRLFQDDDWRWIVDCCRRPAEHLLIGSSVPAFVPYGVHDLQVWDEEVADGRWGRLPARAAESLRRKLDLEDWPSFSRSFRDLVGLLRELATQERAPGTITVLSGDIHFSYLARVDLEAEAPVRSAVHQLVNSPIRNALRPKERRAMRFAMSRTGTLIGEVLRRSVRKRSRAEEWGVEWEMEQGPIFDNCLGQITFSGRHAEVVQEQSRPADQGPTGLVRVYEAVLAPPGTAREERIATDDDGGSTGTDRT